MAFTRAHLVRNHAITPLLVALAALAVFGLDAGRARAQAAPSVTIPQITLTPGEEIPAPTGNPVVLGYFNMSISGTTLTYDLSGDGAMFTAAHIHLGAKGVAGAIVLPLFKNPAGQPAFHVVGTATPADLTGPLAGNWAGFLAALAQGNLYVNEHSAANPAGTARAQIPATNVPGAATPAPPVTGGGVDRNATLPSWPALLGLALLTISLAGLGVAASHEIRARR